MMRVSVVICTLNRADGLRATLSCLAQQRGADFEVIVVNGPSTDHTVEVLDEFGAAIRTAQCPMQNLSMSRNIGIRAATGDVVAFIDDDALPEFEWLVQALPPFADPEVAGVGGVVFDHTGYTHQYNFSAANRFGEPTFSTTSPFDALCSPGAFTFPYLQGTNALFRRSALLRIGGFDETYDYYLDETDLCCRLVDAGYVLRQVANAPVHHKFLPSGIRDHQRIVTNWFPIVKNNTYFAYRHALGSFSEAEVIRRSLAFIDRMVADATFHEEGRRIPAGSAERARAICGEAFGLGVELGRGRADVRLSAQQADAATFKPYPSNTASGVRRIAIISGDYAPRITGGIARIMSELAPALAQRGHEVRVLTRGSTHSTVDLEDGVWVHRLATHAADGGGLLPSALAHINEFTTAAAAELDRIGTWAPIDLVYAPAWDVEALAALRGSPLPVVTMLATPVAVAATQQSAENESLPSDVAELLRLETDVYCDSDLVHALSKAIVDTVVDRYGPVLDPARTAIVALGLPDRGRSTSATIAAEGSELTVLFVGRLEPRKGIIDFFGAVEMLAPLYANVRFVLAGADTPILGGAGWFGERWAAEHANEEWFGRVMLRGNISDDELHEGYADADIVVLPSRYESFGLVVVEAMMHSKPIVSCRAGGIPEVVVDGIDAMLVPPADPEALAVAIADLIRSPERRAALGQHARESYLQRFTISACAERLERLAARLSLVDPGNRAYSTSGPVVLCGTAAGHPVVHLAPGACADIDARVDGALTLPVRASSPAVVVVETAGTAQRIDIVAPGWSRLKLGHGNGRVRITVLSGSIRLSSAIVTAEP